jgi:tetratricopeptide (TPR) repeat protein
MMNEGDCVLDDVESMVREYVWTITETLESVESADTVSVREPPPVPSAVFKGDVAGAILTVNRYFEAPGDVLQEYALLRFVLRNPSRPEPQWDDEFLDRRLIGLAWSAGEYRDAIELADRWHADYAAYSSRDGFARCCSSVLNRKAKALRNLGRFEEAMAAYRQALAVCEESSLGIERAIQLMAIGKMYGHYMSSASTFWLFTKLALDHLGSLATDGEEEVRRSVRRYQAICHDSFGQIVSHANFADTEADKHFERAIEINNEIGNVNGLSRNYCHRAMLWARRAAVVAESGALEEFNRGYSLLRPHGSDQRGFGVRTVQLAELLASSGRRSEAKDRASIALDLSRRFRDHRTYIRCCLLLAELSDASGELAKIEKLLGDARKRACRFRLAREELLLNRRLGGLVTPRVPLSRSNVSLEFFQRNRGILKKLNEGLIASSRAVAHGQERGVVEFEQLSHDQRVQLGEGILHDYNSLVHELDSDVDAMITIIQRQGDISLLDLSGALARAVFHDFKHTLKGAAFDERCNAAVDRIHKVQLLMKDRAITVPESAGRARKDDLMVTLGELEDDVTALSKKFGDLQELTIAKMAHSRTARWAKGSLVASCEAAIAEIRRREKRDLEVEFQPQTDLILPCDEDWLARTVANLIRNGIEAGRDADTASRASVVLSLGRVGIGDDRFCNSAYVVDFEVANVGRPGDGEKLQTALEGRGTRDKPDGTGVGLELARLFLVTICQGMASCREENGFTKLKFRFQPDGGRIQAINLPATRTSQSGVIEP